MLLYCSLQAPGKKKSVLTFRTPQMASSSCIPLIKHHITLQLHYNSISP